MSTSDSEEEIAAGGGDTTKVKCVGCQKNFADQSSLFQHMLGTKHAIASFCSSGFGCSVCGEYFTTFDEEKAHVKSIHADAIVNLRCPLCAAQLSFDSLPELTQHVKATHRRCCRFCAADVGGSTAERQLHISRVHPSVATEVRRNCNDCRRTLDGGHMELNNHLLTAHGKPFCCKLGACATSQQAKIQQPPRPVSKVSETVITKTIVCPLHPGKRFNRIAELVAHLKTDHSTECLLCGFDVTIIGRRAHRDECHPGHSDKHDRAAVYPCPICHKLQLTHCYLNNHLTMLHGGKPFCCLSKMCGIWTKGIKQSHPNPKKLKCVLCPGTPVREADLAQHMKAVHPGVCRLCGVQSGTDALRKQHMAITHMSVDPTRALYRCDLCDDAFGYVPSLTTHCLYANHMTQMHAQQFCCRSGACGKSLMPLRRRPQKTTATATTMTASATESKNPTVAKVAPWAAAAAVCSETGLSDDGRAKMKDLLGGEIDSDEFFDMDALEQELFGISPDDEQEKKQEQEVCSEKSSLTENEPSVYASSHSSLPSIFNATEQPTKSVQLPCVDNGVNLPNGVLKLIHFVLSNEPTHQLTDKQLAQTLKEQYGIAEFGDTEIMNLVFHGRSSIIVQPDDFNNLIVKLK